jgi:hypothetical protein
MALKIPTTHVWLRNASQVLTIIVLVFAIINPTRTGVIKPPMSYTRKMVNKILIGEKVLLPSEYKLERAVSRRQLADLIQRMEIRLAHSRRLETIPAKTPGGFPTALGIRHLKDKTFKPPPADSTFTRLPLTSDPVESRTKFSSSTPLNDGYSRHPEAKWVFPDEGDTFFHWQLTPNPDATSLQKYSKLRVAIEKRDSGWASVGWGPHMFQGEVLSVERDMTNPLQLIVSECTLRGYTQPLCREMKEWKVVHHESNVQSYWVEFEKILDGKGLFDRFINVDGEQYLEWAATPDRGRIRKHSGVGTFGLVIVDFSNDKVYHNSSNYNWVVMFHVWGLLICWTFVVDVLILWGRYAKSTKYYYEVHSWGMMAMVVVSLTATV